MGQTLLQDTNYTNIYTVKYHRKIVPVMHFISSTSDLQKTKNKELTKTSI